LEVDVSQTLLGFPPQTWGLLCLAVAAFYLVKAPRPRIDDPGAPRARWAAVVLRWFHGVVWLLLAAACFLWAAAVPAAATGAALSALVLYLVYFFTLMTARKSEPPRQR
jgi:drug/metabolite transporter (DMT)-like permease